MLHRRHSVCNHGTQVTGIIVAEYLIMVALQKHLHYFEHLCGGITDFTFTFTYYINPFSLNQTYVIVFKH